MTQVAPLVPERDDVFILDLTCNDGGHFVTSVSTLSGMAPTMARHKAKAAQVSHWRRDLPVDITVAPEQGERLTRDWRLAERFAL